MDDQPSPHTAPAARPGPVAGRLEAGPALTTRDELIAALTGVRLASGRGSLPAGPLPVLVARPSKRPYPLVELLAHSRLLRENLAPGRGGVPLALSIVLLNPADGWRPLTGAVVYCWHGECHGVQLSDSTGRVRFGSVFPSPRADGHASLRLQIFVIEGGHVAAMVNVRVEMPAHVTALVHGRTTGVEGSALSAQVGHESALRLGQLDGNPQDGYSGCLTLGITT